jgi:hypothetical protein
MLSFYKSSHRPLTVGVLFCKQAGVYHGCVRIRRNRREYYVHWNIPSYTQFIVPSKLLTGSHVLSSIEYPRQCT